MSIFQTILEWKDFSMISMVKQLISIKLMIESREVLFKNQYKIKTDRKVETIEIE